MSDLSAEQPTIHYILPRTFYPFRRLPIELQYKIFRFSMPPPQIVDAGLLVWAHHVILDPSDPPATFLDFALPEAQSVEEVLPLLLACRTSLEEIHHCFQKVAVQKDTRSLVYTDYLNNSQVPLIVQGVRVRPTVDYLLIEPFDLMRLSRYGWSFNTSMITRLLCENCFGENSKIDLELLDWIPRHFPALRTLYFMNYRTTDLPHMPDVRILEIDRCVIRDLLDQNFVDSTEDPMTVTQLRHVSNTFERELSEAMYLELLLNTYMHPHDDDDEELSDETKENLRISIDYYKRLRPKQAICYWFDGNKCCPHTGTRRPMIWFNEVKGWLPAYADGSLVDKYKGLAQIFEGALW